MQTSCGYGGAGSIQLLLDIRSFQFSVIKKPKKPQLFNKIKTRSWSYGKAHFLENTYTYQTNIDITTTEKLKRFSFHQI